MPACLEILRSRCPRLGCRRYYHQVDWTLSKPAKKGRVSFEKLACTVRHWCLPPRCMVMTRWPLRIKLRPLKICPRTLHDRSVFRELRGLGTVLYRPGSNESQGRNSLLFLKIGRNPLFWVRTFNLEASFQASGRGERCPQCRANIRWHLEVEGSSSEQISHWTRPSCTGPWWKRINHPTRLTQAQWRRPGWPFHWVWWQFHPRSCIQRVLLYLGGPWPRSDEPRFAIFSWRQKGLYFQPCASWWF